MRIHRLEVVAFGPFAKPVAVDFDALSDAGLFLLTGATGAGKTSILDAVCFALYGAVPGDRQTAKRLRSDHADPGVAPEVCLELTVAGRRLRIVRSPAWRRPKRRGSGTTQEPARVLVTERVAGSWQPLATRLDEAGHLVSELLGMNLNQFCQVQLLPQGRFQAFLRADSGERHELLQKLFRTSRFVAIESWLRERRRSLRRADRAHHEEVVGLVSRMSEAAGQPVPATWDLHDLSPAASELLPWSTGVLTEASRTLAESREEAAAAEVAEVEARTALETARRHHDLRRRLLRARREHDELAAQEPAHTERTTRLDAARRAASLRPLRHEVERASAACVVAVERAADGLARVHRLLGVAEVDESGLATLQQQLADRLAQARARLPLADEHARLLGADADDRAALAALAEDLAALERDLATLPDRLDALRAAEAGARAARDRLPGVEQQRDAALAALGSARRAEELTARRAVAEEDLRAAVDHAQDLREQWLEIQERRISGMAAEIAGGLAVGACCPVCGSADHPQPARPAPGAPDAETERRARRDLDDAEAVRHARAGAVRDLATAIEHAREQAGDRDPDDLEREADAAAETVTRLEQEAAALDAAVGAREEAEEEWREVTARRADVLQRRAAREAAAAERRDRARAVAAELEDLLTGTDATTVTDLVRRLSESEDACRRAVDAVAERSRAEHTAAEVRERAEAAAVAAGFDSLAEADTTELPDDEMADLAEAVRRHEVRRGTVTELLRDPDLLAAEAAPAVDPDALEVAHTAAAERHARAGAAASRAAERAERLRRLDQELADSVAGWTPAREALELADRLATLVDGSSGDNRLRMRLSGYVLAFRLQQVVAAANERLVIMTDGRYRLEHTGDRGAGETRGGLSLLVRDDWTGEARDPVTLSGGETFVVSLALALGLSDVITHEAGGAELDTLFVDEGFGTLDAETLDHVMDMLDGLRDGGRVVGVVSHVAELRDRIPVQLHVRKTRTGSTLHPGGVG